MCDAFDNYIDMIKKLLGFCLFCAVSVSGWSQLPQYPNGLKVLGGWTASDSAQYFTPETLYDHINGASDFYLGYLFRDLWVNTYQNQTGQSLTLEIYRHANPNCAFGIYAEERPAAVALLSIGNEGFVADGAAYFWACDMYVKVFGGNPAPSTAQLSDFSQQVVGVFCDTVSSPAQLSWFPAGKIERSERYIPDGFLGRSGFDNVFTAEYLIDGEKVKLFLLSGTEENTIRLMDKYLADCGAKRNAKADRYILKDRINGRVAIVQHKGLLVGVTGHPKPEKAWALIDELLSNAQK